MWQIPSAVIYVLFFIDFFVLSFYLAIFLGIKRKKDSGTKEFRDVTFVVPAYNREKELEITVDSIKNSDYPQERIKIIIVDDGSQDRTLEVARKLAKKYSRIKVLTKKNGGKADALNYGIKQVDTALFAVLDADTILQRDLLKKSISYFDKESISAVTSRMKPEINSRLIEKIQNIEYNMSAFYRMLLSEMNSLQVAPAFTVMKTEFVKKYGGFDTNNITEDFEMGLRLQSKHQDMGFVVDSYALTRVPNTLKSFYRQRLRWGYGTLFNFRKYRNLFFNRKYGDLGFFTMPASFLSVMVVSLVLLMAVYGLIGKAITYIQMLSVGWTPEFSFDFSNLSIILSDPRFLLFFLSAIIGVVVFLMIKLKLKDDMKFRHYVLFITVYMWFIALIYIISLLYFIVGKKPEW